MIRLLFQDLWLFHTLCDKFFKRITKNLLSQLLKNKTKNQLTLILTFFVCLTRISGSKSVFIVESLFNLHQLGCD
jgi:hypothetical protein